MIRTLGGIVAGMAAAITLMMITEAIGNQVSPTRIDVGVADEPASPLPLVNLLFPVLGWFLGALIGGFLAIKISDEPWTAWAVAGVVFAATVFNFVMMAYPVWLILAGLVVPILGGWLAKRICAMASRAD